MVNSRGNICEDCEHWRKEIKQLRSDRAMLELTLLASTDDRLRLLAIVDRLPKTADGVPVVPEVDTIFMICHNKANPIQERTAILYRLKAERCYSTRKAAEVATSENDKT